MSGLKVPQLVFKNTNVISAGTDIVYLPRIERLLLKYRASPRLNRVLTKFMHQNEISHFNRLQQYEPLKSQVIYIAGIWAIKEALLKTLPAGFGKPPAIQIYTKLLYKTNTPDGKPELHLDKDSFLNDETKNYWNKYLERTKMGVADLIKKFESIAKDPVEGSPEPAQPKVELKKEADPEPVAAPEEPKDEPVTPEETAEEEPVTEEPVREEPVKEEPTEEEPVKEEPTEEEAVKEEQTEEPVEEEQTEEPVEEEQTEEPVKEEQTEEPVEETTEEKSSEEATEEKPSEETTEEPSEETTEEAAEEPSEDATEEATEEPSEEATEEHEPSTSSKKKNKKKKNKKKKKSANAESEQPSASADIDARDTRLGRDSPFDFGKRVLKDDEEVWNHNAWDNVEWGEEQIKAAEEKIQKQYENPVPEFDKNLYNSNPSRYWDIFYKNNRENFFKDRKWLQVEFPSLYEATKPDAGPKTIFEIGCGAGNTFFPILNENENEQLKIVAADFAPRAVELVKESEQFNPKYGHATVWDLANTEGQLPDGIEPHSVDIAVMIFVFSALSPEQWETAMDNLHKIMKPGGQILFRDYGRYDLAQVRFKKNRLLDDNFYVRGDGTRVYFFTEQELREIFTKKYFVEDQIGTDRRLLVNRKRQLKMYRVWLQAVFKVPELEVKENSS
ncbi:hypothetical protein KLMA_20196 [Kluyveromyces marxianus DMKU3-1042]|uniref:Uncharacterized protein n=1 Tax=Kluyveromyces marxianus (strain DMKU3-1042 / BCC 29191 / NBRC 104275) TaxID=1003335 RepID=W0T978_KLUMD|nr:hypothetical protein KLMA_20196 [Kluyveromyces marxianus DMKU3-1042]BAO38654.2 hypothetical protein KLMA_20196 [Kluyveromyces marxianus DMKU3-1042]